jgi:hypothetical protein
MSFGDAKGYKMSFSDGYMSFIDAPSFSSTASAINVGDVIINNTTGDAAIVTNIDGGTLTTTDSCGGDLIIKAGDGIGISANTGDLVLNDGHGSLFKDAGESLDKSKFGLHTFDASEDAFIQGASSVSRKLDNKVVADFNIGRKKFKNMSRDELLKAVNGFLDSGPEALDTELVIDANGQSISFRDAIDIIDKSFDESAKKFHSNGMRCKQCKWFDQYNKHSNQLDGTYMCDKCRGAK